MTKAYDSYHYMLMFSLGPVQPFIEQARKSRDLWLGSFLLSKLMEAALTDYQKKIHQQDALLIFPTNPVLNSTIPDLPNKYVALFHESEQAEAAAKESIRAIYERWQKICDDVWNRIFLRYQPESMVNARSIWDRQTNPQTLFELFWVVVKGDADHYHTWLEGTQQALDARKRLRDFQHLYNPNAPGELIHEMGEKSTISGHRTALYGKDGSREGVCTFWKALAEKLSVFDLNHEGEERLDAIDSVKRFAFHSTIIRENVKALTVEDANKLRIGYPSTSSIATAPYVEQLLRLLEKEPAWPEITAWSTITGDYKDKPLANMPIHTLPYLYEHAGKQKELLKRDGDCYFLDTFTTNRLKKTYGLTDAKLPDTGQRALSELLQATKAHNITPPTPYYAMILMDGDRMGGLLSKVENPSRHIAISEALSTFSRLEVQKLVEKRYPGRLIYAGGDDVFAMAPLLRDRPEPKIAEEQEEFFSILKLADALQERYSITLGAALQATKLPMSDKTPRDGELSEVAPEFRDIGVSASMGIAITHHYTSLSYVRRIVKEAENLAKHRYGRNALVVSVIRRSGEQTTVGCHWRYPELKQEGLLQPLALFELFLELFKQDVLSPKCIHILLDEAPALIGMADKLNGSLEEQATNERKSIQISKQDVRVSETARVFNRQSDKQHPLLVQLEIDFTTLAWNIVSLAEAMDNDKDEHGQIRASKSKRVLELHASQSRRGLIEVLGWLQVMAFLTRKGQE